MAAREADVAPARLEPRTFLERPLSLPGACQADLLWLASNPFWTAAPLEPLFRSLHYGAAEVASPLYGPLSLQNRQ